MPETKSFSWKTPSLGILIGFGAALFFLLNMITSFMFGFWIVLGFLGLIFLIFFLLSPDFFSYRRKHYKAQRARGLLFSVLAVVILTVMASAFAMASCFFAIIVLFSIAAFFAYTLLCFGSFLFWAGWKQN